MNITLKGKRYCVNGAGGIFGRALIKEMVHLGAKVFAVDTQMTTTVKRHLDHLASEIPGVETRLLDISNWRKTQHDILNAGVFNGMVNTVGVIELQDFLAVTKTNIHHSFVTNVRADICISQAVAKGMIENRLPGVIVNISTQTNKLGLQKHTVFCATKGAIDEITKAMVADLEEHKIKVYSVNPTLVLTEIGLEAWKDSKNKDAMVRKVPLQRFAEVNEAVSAIIYCLSDECNIVNGASVPVDGGFSAD